MSPELERLLRAEVLAAPDPGAAVEGLRELLHRLSPRRGHPVDHVRWVPLAQVTPNDYNPNSVARVEMGLLHTSIAHDGYTQPVVTFWDGERGLYVIVDGFHRYFVCKTYPDVLESTGGLLPVVVIEKTLAERMASTVRHNRARGKHSVRGMANLVFGMLHQGMGDAEVCNALGMAPEELLRLKHVTGFSKLFKDAAYRKAWMTERQILIARNWRRDHPGETHGEAPAQGAGVQGAGQGEGRAEGGGG